MLYHVYIWKEPGSVEAEIYEELTAQDEQEAALAAMRKHALFVAYYVWVVSGLTLEDLTSVDLYFVVCPLVPGVSG